MGFQSAFIAAELKRQRPNVPIPMLIKNPEGVAHGATAQADAVRLKSEETEGLHEALKGLVKT